MSGTSSELKNHSQFIRAGAGAGKTTQLIQSFLYFVRDFQESHKRFPRIVITTFTRKATQEVKERLLVSALKENEKSIFEYINRKSFVHISTIHGLLSLYLTQFADLISLPQEIKIVDGAQYQRTLRKNIHRLLKKKTRYIQLLESYPFYQLVDLSKKALDLKSQNLDFNFVRAIELKAITHTKLQSIQDRLQAIFHLVPSIPEKWSEYFKYLRGILGAIVQQDECQLLNLIETTPRKPTWSAAKPVFDEQAHELIEELRELKLFQFQDTEEYRLEHEKLNDLFFHFIQDLYKMDYLHKQTTGELTISDLENLSGQLVAQFPESAKEFSDSWDYFMVDEYQDTSPLQVGLLNQLVQDKPCFIVGDPQQSIYLFRGARSEVFTEKESELKHKNQPTRILDRNFRSEPSLMIFMNQFFDSFSQQFAPMQIREPNPGRTHLTDAFFIKTYNEELAVLRQIQQLMGQGVSAKDICVLSKSNARLIELAQAAQKYHVPVQLQAASGFEDKREILDLISFLKFLVNPHDNENLITLLRSPWLHLEDEILFKLCQSPDAKLYSIWNALFKSQMVLKEKMLYYLDFFEMNGSSLTVKEWVKTSGFIAFSNLLDKTGKREANIWKFMTTLADSERESGFSLGLFIEDRFQSLQSDLGSSAGEAQPVIQPDCVSLMTVHASKGLEFKHVIIMGLTDKPKITTQIKLAFEPKTAKFSLSTFDRTEGGIKPSNWSEEIRKELNQRELAENERVLYVAMTRAQESVSLIARIARENERLVIVSESWFKKMLWPESNHRENEPKFHIESLLYDDQMDAFINHPSEKIFARRKWRVGENVLANQSSVTDLVSQELGEASALIDYQKLVLSLKKAQKGTELHRLFESMKYRSIEQLKKSMNSEELGMVDYLLNQTDVNLKEILAQGFNEWGFGLKTSKTFLQGQIDAWAELQLEIHILDYKTGSSEFHEKAFEQLNVYTLALAQMGFISKNKSIVHSVLYASEKKIIKREFKDLEGFKNSVSPKIKALFD